MSTAPPERRRTTAQMEAALETRERKIKKALRDGELRALQLASALA